MKRSRRQHLLIGLSAALLWAAGCESKDTSKAPSGAATEATGAPADSAAEPAAATDAASASAPSDASSPEAPSRLNGRAISDPKAYTHPDAPALGTLPEGIGLAPGATVADFAVTNTSGERVTRDNLLAEAPLLVVFYRGGW